MATNNENRVKRNSLNMIDLGEITDDELPEITHLLVHLRKVVPLEGGPIPENQPLSQRIGLCTNMTKLVVVNCSSLPPEIFICPKLSQLTLSSSDRNDDDCRIELPEGSILSNLTTVCIGGGGNWNTSGIMTWLATCSSNLHVLSFGGLTKKTANQFMTELQNNNAFIEKFKHKLQFIAFTNCNLNEDDARVIIVIMTRLYPNLSHIVLRNNNIEGIDTVAMAVRETPPANSNLRGLNLGDNPFSPNLNDPNSSDHDAMIDLLKKFPLLHMIDGNNNETITCTSLINYWLMMNRSGLRYLVVDIHGGTRLSGILPHVMNHAQNPTAVFTFLREGPIFRTQYQNNVVVVVDDNDNNDDSDDDDGDDDEYDLSLLLRHHH